MTETNPFTVALREWAEVFMRRSMQDFSQFLRDNGLSMPQASALFRLYDGGGCGVSDMANHLDVTSAAASQMIDRLVQQGLLKRSEHPRDRRIKQVTLTPAGRVLAERSIKAHQAWIDGLAAALTAEEQAKMATMLQRLVEAANQVHPISEQVP